ncbi:glycosyltransferase family 39 protein [bacterium]|nr:glycosyltransferase family 39 protein [bacterium]
MVSSEISFRRLITRLTSLNQNRNLLLIIILILGALLRISVFGLGDFHGDEALYSFRGAEIALRGDWFFQAEDVDKPPLLPYLAALSFRIFGFGDNTARLPNFFASLISIWLVYQICCKCFDKNTARIAAFLMAISPYNILYGPTVFEDTLFACLLLFSIYFLCIYKEFWAGIFLGLCFCAKQFGVLAMPIIGAFSIILRYMQWVQTKHSEFSFYIKKPLMKLVFGFSMVFAGLLIWAVFFEDPRLGIIFQVNATGGVFKIMAGELTPRLFHWLSLYSKFTNSSVVNMFFLISAPALIAYEILNLKNKHRFKNIISLCIGGYIALMLGTFTLFRFGFSPHYLMFIIPFVFILLARYLSLLLQFFTKTKSPTSLAIFALGLGLVLLINLTSGTLDGIKNLGFGARWDNEDGFQNTVEYFSANADRFSTIYYTRSLWSNAYYYFFNKGFNIRPVEFSNDIPIGKFSEEIWDRVDEGVYLLLEHTGQIKKIQDAFTKNPQMTYYKISNVYNAYGHKKLNFKLYKVSLKPSITLASANINSYKNSKKLEAYLKAIFERAWRNPKEFQITLASGDKLDLNEGKLGDIICTASGIKLGRKFKGLIKLTWKDARINPEALFLYHKLIPAQSNNIYVEVSIEDITNHILSTNKQVTTCYLTGSGKNMELDGTAHLLGRDINFQMSGTLNIKDRATVEIYLVNARLGNIKIPSWLLPLVSKKLNPLFDLKSLFLGVPLRHISIEKSKIVFGT